MALTFDGPNKTIILGAGTTEVAVTYLWSRWCDWYGTADNSKYTPAMRFVGGDPISATKNLGMTFFMINGWRIRPQEADHRLVVTGNLYTDPAGFSPFVATLGVFNVSIEMQVSNLSDSTVAQMDQINAAVYRGEVALDVAHGSTGTLFPKGTHQTPSNNVADTLTIAGYYGIEKIRVHGSLTLDTGHDISGYVVSGENAITTLLTINPGANVANCQFEDMVISDSTLDGMGYVRHCALHNVAGIEGYVESSMLSGALSLTGTQNVYFVDCKSGCVGLGTADLPVLSMAGTGRHVAFRNYAGPIKITNSTDPANTICLDIASGATITIDPSCTAGTVYVRGIANIPPTAHGMTVITTAQLDQVSIGSAVWSSSTVPSAFEIANAVWGRMVDGGYTAEELQRLFAAVLFGKVNGAGSGVEDFLSLAGDKVRVRSTVDESGNRTAIELNTT